jgi:glycosyltransferase involved in cell wall biosynthesis
VYIPRFWFSAIPLLKAHKKPVLVHLHDYVPICPLSSLYDFETSSVCTLEGCSQKCIYKYEQTFGRNTESRLASTLLNSTFGRNLHQLVSLSDCIICVSKAQRDIVVDKLPQLSGKTEVIYNPLPNCTPSPLDGVGFGFLGGSNPIKGFQILQTALTELTQTNQHLTVHATNFASPPQTQQFTHAKILFYKRLNATELDKFYCNVRTLIFPSICPEPLPYAVTEAILRGRLVIASNSGGTAELAKDCPGVFLYPSGNSTELARLMQQTAQLSTPQATELSQQNRAVFLKRFTNEDSSSCFIQCCKNLLL